MAVEGNSQPPHGSPTNLPPSEQAIRQQLEKILTSPQFANSPNLSNFLRFIVDLTLAGEAATIKGYTVRSALRWYRAEMSGAMDGQLPGT